MVDGIGALIGPDVMFPDDPYRLCRCAVPYAVYKGSPAHCSVGVLCQCGGWVPYISVPRPEVS